MNQVADDTSAGAGADAGASAGSGADEQPWNDPQFVMQRTTMCDRIYQYLGRGEPPERDLWLPQLTRKLEEILYTRFPNKNDYFHMMMGPVGPQIRFAFDILKMEDTPPLSSGVLCQQFVMLRTAMREKIFEYIGRRHSPAMWGKVLTNLARQLEEILYTKFPNINDYDNMMKGPIAPPLMFAARTFKARRKQIRQDPQMASETPSSSGTIDMDVNLDGLCEQFSSLLADTARSNNAE